MAQAIQFAILGLGVGAAYTLLAQGISGGPNGGMGFVTESRSVFMSLTGGN